MSFSLSVIAPFLNEEENLLAFLKRATHTLEKMRIEYELLVIDDGSVDGSAQIVANFVKLNPELPVALIAHNANLGIFESWKTGLEVASKDLVVLIDTDLQNPPEAIQRLHEAFLSNTCHFVQGVRSNLEMGSGWRFFQSRVLNKLLNVFFRSKAKDNKSGFILGPRELFRRGVALVPDLKFGQTFIRVALESSGYLICEVETIFYRRVAGKSFLSGKTVIAGLRVLLEILTVGSSLRRLPRNSVLYPLTEISDGVEAKRPSNLRERLFKTLFFSTLPFHTWNISYRALKYLQVLEKTEWLESPDIESLTLKRLDRLLWHVFGRVPHYRKYFIEKCMLPSAVQTLDQLSLLPLLEKLEVKDALFFDLFSLGADRRRLHRISTSGSTGSPFTTYADYDQLDVRFASTLRAQQMTGWRFGDRQLRLWHQNLGLSFFQELREKLNALVSRRVFVPAFELDSVRIEKLVQTIENYRPVLIDGYAESMNYLAKATESVAIKHAPRAVMTSAQVLTHQTRQAIQTQFNTQVFDKYGSREFSGIAYECKAQNGHHVQWESYIVEILRNGRTAKPGEVGEVVITDLNNFSVPLIRYRIGDLAEAMKQESCECGRHSMRLGKIVGRTQALVLVSGGKWLPGTFFAHFFKDFESVVSHFQVVQRSRGSFELRIVKGPHWTSKGWAECVKELSSYTGPETVIKTKFVKEIPLLKTGKRTPVISDVRYEFQEL